MNNFGSELQNISDNDIKELNNEDLLKAYKMIKEYVKSLEQEIQKVNEND